MREDRTLDKPIFPYRAGTFLRSAPRHAERSCMIRAKRLKIPELLASVALAIVGCIEAP